MMRRTVLAGLALLGVLTAAQAAQAAPPRNDNYLASVRINDTTGALPARFQETVETTEATTQLDLFDPSRDGQPLGGSGPEPTSCASAPSYGKTVWYDFIPPTRGAVRIATSGFDNVFAVYRFNFSTAQLGKLIACQNASTGVSEERQIQRPLRGGRAYTIQVGGVNGAAGALDFSFEYFPDRDGDEVFDEAPDKCLSLQGIRAFGGCPPVVRGAPLVTVVGSGNGVRVTRLTVDKADKGTRVEVRCRRCGAPVRARGRRGGSIRVRRFEDRVLSNGDRLQVRVTRHRSRSGRFRFGAIGKVVTWPIKSNGLGAPTRRCTRPGSPRRIKCPT